MFNKYSIVLVSVLAVGGNPAQAELPTDFYVQSDHLDDYTGVGRYQQAFIEDLLERGYPTPAIIMQAVDRGMSISDVVYLLTRAQPERAAEFYQTAIDMLPNLPGSACLNQSEMDYRYAKTGKINEQEDSPSIREVAQRYFEKHERVEPFPEDWLKTNRGHMNAKIDELLALAQEEANRQREQGKGDAPTWWYQAERIPVGGTVPVFASLYPKDKRIVLDTDLETLMAMKAQGKMQVPVVLVFNRDDHIPASDIEPNAVPPGGGLVKKDGNFVDYGDGHITASEVVDKYFSGGQKLTPPREWHEVDHHLMVQTEEWTKGKLAFELPKRDEIGEKRWNEIAQQLKSSGFSKPVIITLRRDSGEKWADDLDWVAVAAEMKVEWIPTVFLFNESNRWPCGVPAACEDNIYLAAERAGADVNALGSRPGVNGGGGGAGGGGQVQGFGSRSPN